MSFLAHFGDLGNNFGYFGDDRSGLGDLLDYPNFLISSL